MRKPEYPRYIKNRGEQIELISSRIYTDIDAPLYVILFSKFFTSFQRFEKLFKFQRYHSSQNQSFIPGTQVRTSHTILLCRNIRYAIYVRYLKRYKVALQWPGESKESYPLNFLLSEVKQVFCDRKHFLVHLLALNCFVN